MAEMDSSDADQTPQERQRSYIATLIEENFQRLPAYKRLFFDYGTGLVCVNSMVCGIAANTFFRRYLNVRKYPLATILPVAVMPSFLSGLYYEILITQQLRRGELRCQLCTMTRGAYIGLFMGGVAPIFLAGCINSALITDARRIPHIPKGNIFREILCFVKPAMNSLKYFLLLQALTSILVANGQMAILEELLEVPPVQEPQGKL